MIKHGCALDVMKTLGDNSVDSIVTDPPYGLSFMGKKWDYDVPSVELWREALRVLKPGGHVLSFGGTRTYHRMVVNIEDAGFEIRDQVMWLYGSGFPKSQDVSKQIDKQAGAVREVVGVAGKSGSIRNAMAGDFKGGEYMETDPATPEAKEWEGWGTALKPAWEVICMAVKPLTVADELGILALELCQSKLFASAVNRIFLSNQKGSDEASNIAQWLAGKNTLTLAGLSALTDTLLSESAPTSSSNIELSWLNILVALLKHGSTFTTETKSSLTIDLRILKSLVSKITPENMRLSDGLGLSADVLTAETLFDALELKLSFILTPSVHDLVTSKVDQKSLRPDSSPICVARKPLEKGLTVAANVLKYGTGAINIDASRVTGGKMDPRIGKNISYGDGSGSTKFGQIKTNMIAGNPAGRWPSNLILDEEAAAALDEQVGHLVGAGNKSTKKANQKTEKSVFGIGGDGTPSTLYDRGGSASRFFKVIDSGLGDITTKCQDLSDLSSAKPVTKTSKQDESNLNSAREAVKTNFKNDPNLLRFLDSIPDSKKCFLYQDLALHVAEPQSIGTTEIIQSLLKLFGSALLVTEENIKAESLKNECAPKRFIYQAKASKRERGEGNRHPCVKPIKLMEYLIKLVTPPSGIVLDPFMGSGTTGLAAKNLGFDFIGIEREAEYVAIAEKRIASVN